MYICTCLFWTTNIIFSHKKNMLDTENTSLEYLAFFHVPYKYSLEITSEIVKKINNNGKLGTQQVFTHD